MLSVLLPELPSSCQLLLLLLTLWLVLVTFWTIQKLEACWVREREGFCVVPRAQFELGTASKEELGQN